MERIWSGYGAGMERVRDVQRRLWVPPAELAGGPEHRVRNREVGSRKFVAKNQQSSKRLVLACFQADLRPYPSVSAARTAFPDAVSG
jgi:hypothetical protein